MGNYSKILVAFDGSRSSRNALEQTLAGFEKSWIKVLAVIPAYEGDLEMIGVHDLEGLLRGPTDEIVAEAKSITGPEEESRVNIEVSRGVAFEKILDVASNEDCTLIVMGRRGLHRLERMLMGSVTAKVLVHSDRDVLVIPRDGKIGWDKIVVATDGSSYSAAALAKAARFASEYGGELTAISVVDIHPESYADAADVVEKLERKAAAVLESAAADAEAAGIAAKTKLLRGDPAEEISRYAEENGAGIIFMGSRGRTGLKKVFLGSVAGKTIGLAHSPVFVTKTAVAV